MKRNEEERLKELAQSELLEEEEAEVDLNLCLAASDASVFHAKANPKFQSLCLEDKYIWAPGKKAKLPWAEEMSLVLARSRTAGPHPTKGWVSLLAWVSVV